MIDTMIKQLHELCLGLLERGAVQGILGYAEGAPGAAAVPIFLTDIKDIEKLTWNDRCFSNLATYLTRAEIKRHGKIGIVVKSCDARALTVLVQESQLNRASLYVIGMACDGVSGPWSVKCAACDSPVPTMVDDVIGQVSSPRVPEERYSAIRSFLNEKSSAERMAFWQEELARCTKCYACRAVCPMCYCLRCIVDKNRPTTIDTSATLKGNFAWHITRAFHLAGRCVGCGECARVCPAGIDLGLLNETLACAAERHFEYRAGCDPEKMPVIGCFNASDQEDFIR